LSENSKYKFGNGISITTGFDVATQLPLDSRTVVQTQADLENISDNIKYEGLLVFVVDQNKLYQWKQELLEDGTYTPDYRWGPIESEISAKKIEDIGELDLDNIKSLQMQKNKVNFFPITHEKFIYNEKGESLFEELKEYQKKDLSADESGEKLETEMQTIVGAINELNSKMDDTIEDFENKINQTIKDLNASVDQMQKETSEDMAEMKANLQAEINKVLADLDAKSKEMDKEFADLLAEVNRQVTELQDKIQDDIDQMLQDVDNSILSDDQVIDLMDKINANIAAIDGNGVIAASFETYASVVVVDTAVSEVSITGLGVTVNSSDKLFVHMNSIYLVENVDYRIDMSSQKIVCLTGEWNSYNIAGCEFAFDLIKKIITVE
jgi:hypothetical protein